MLFAAYWLLKPQPHEVAVRVEKITPTAIGEHNGANCTSTRTTREVAVFRVDQDMAGPVYVNLVAKSEVPGGGNARVVVKRGDSFVRSVRYGAAFPL